MNDWTNDHVRWFNLFKSCMDAWNMDQSIDFHESSIGGARAYVQLVINECLPGLEDSDAEYLQGFMPDGSEDWQELAKSMYKLCAFCCMPGWSMYLDPIPEIYTK